MGLSGLLDHTRVIHELLCHPDTDIMAQVRCLVTQVEVHHDSGEVHHGSKKCIVELVRCPKVRSEVHHGA